MRRLLPFLILSLPLHADTLADVKDALSRLTARAPIRATWSHESSDSTSGRFANDKSERHVSVDVAQDGQSVQLEVPRALVDKAADEGRTNNGSWRNPTRNALAAISLMTISEDLDFAEPFIGMLSRGTVLEEKRLLYNGVQARLLVLQMTEPSHANEGSVGKIKYSENRMSVWIGPDNIPLAAEQSQKATAGFLMLHGDTTGRKSWRFARHDDHFIVARFEESSSFSGLGQHGQGRSVTTVTLR